MGLAFHELIKEGNAGASLGKSASPGHPKAWREGNFLGLLCWKNPCNEVQTMLVKLVYVPCLDASCCCVYFKFQHRYLHKYQHRSSPVQHWVGNWSGTINQVLMDVALPGPWQYCWCQGSRGNNHLYGNPDFIFFGHCVLVFPMAPFLTERRWVFYYYFLAYGGQLI